MRVFLDTNILVSAALFPYGGPAQAYEKATHAPYEAIVSDVVVSELRNVFARKFPKKLDALDRFWAIATEDIEVVGTPEFEQDVEGAVRDVKDRPILRAAIACDADVLVTGDKDFLESGISSPRIMTASEFLAL